MEHGMSFNADDLLALSLEGDIELSEGVANALQGLISPHKGDINFELPSMMTLAGFYNCGHLDVYDALRTLRSRGYEYRLRGIDNKIIVWQA
jgi:hypothetical protein